MTGNHSLKSSGSSKPSTRKLESKLHLDSIFVPSVEMDSSGDGLFLCRPSPRTSPSPKICLGTINDLREILQCAHWNLHPNQFTALIVEDNRIGVVPSKIRKNGSVLLPNQEMAGFGEPPFARVWNRRLVLETVMAVQFPMCSCAGCQSQSEHADAELEWLLTRRDRQAEVVRRLPHLRGSSTGTSTCPRRPRAGQDG